ncbi:MAG: hypothetical protein ACRDJC_02475 [Thermomicrobiales bacterium]
MPPRIGEGQAYIIPGERPGQPSQLAAVGEEIVQGKDRDSIVGAA